MLRDFKILDLTTEMGWLCGKILGDLEADVITVEPPGGDPGRHRGPFYGKAADPEKSLYWFAFAIVLTLITLMLYPQIALWLPAKMK
jgi:crotonobetainyl-CoA:carnitine CoA-transferase CaiB-like acyl-CoA transferase